MRFYDAGGKKIWLLCVLIITRINFF